MLHIFKGLLGLTWAIFSNFHGVQTSSRGPPSLLFGYWVLFHQEETDNYASAFPYAFIGGTSLSTGANLPFLAPPKVRMKNKY
jgi:hypothetical protein